MWTKNKRRFCSCCSFVLVFCFLFSPPFVDFQLKLLSLSYYYFYYHCEKVVLSFLSFWFVIKWKSVRSLFFGVCFKNFQRDFNSLFGVYSFLCFLIRRCVFFSACKNWIFKVKIFQKAGVSTFPLEWKLHRMMRNKGVGKNANSGVFADCFNITQALLKKLNAVDNSMST